MVRLCAILLIATCGVGPVRGFNQVSTASEHRLETGHELQMEHHVHLHKDNKKTFVITGPFIAFVLWCVCPCLLWNNEKIAVKQYKLQMKAERWCVQIDQPEKEPIEALVGRIVHLQGDSTCDAELSDSAFPEVKSVGKIKMRRVVEMYQWQETKDTDDNKTTYDYKKVWSESPQAITHDMSKKNPRMPLRSQDRNATPEAVKAAVAGTLERLGDDGSIAADCKERPCAQAEHSAVKLGAYYLGDYVIRELVNWASKKEDIAPEQLTTPLSSDAGGECLRGPAALERDGWWYFGGRKGGNIGEVRVQFEELSPGPLSICAVLARTDTGFTFVPLIRGPSAQEGALVEAGGSFDECCFRVKQLHYGDGVDVENELIPELYNRPLEFTEKEDTGFRRAKTTTDIKDYEPTNAARDCGGPFPCCVEAMLKAGGLEEEFLGCQERYMTLDELMDLENKLAMDRHCNARTWGTCGLLLGALCCIAPALTLLNANVFIRIFGGAILSSFLILGACACSLGTAIVIIAVAWVFHRPCVAITGLAVAGLLFYVVIYSSEQKQAQPQQQPSPYAAAALFLEIRHAAQKLA